MFKFWKTLGLLVPIILGVFSALASAETLLHSDQPALFSLEPDPADPMDQVTSVSQLSDVQPTDWAFQAVQSLVERYGCIAGYPDGTFKGNRAATRYELAAALNACLDQISDRFTTKEDLATVKALQEAFKTELATLKGRVDGLEARTATLEAQQFSTTTKLQGQVIFAVVDAFGGASGNGQNDNFRTSFGDRVRLNFITSFTGKDQLFVRFQASNLTDPRPATDSAPGNEARLSFQSGSDTTNTFSLGRLQYTFPVNNRVKLSVATGFNVGFIDVIDDVVNPLASDAAGAISRFGRYNPIYRLGSDTGASANIKLNKDLKLELAYLASRAGFSTGGGGNGLFGGNYGALAQIVYAPKFGTIALTYVRADNNNGLGHGTGSVLSNLGGREVSTDGYGLEANFKITPGFQLGGWVGYMNAQARTGVVQGNADIWTYAVTMAFPDLGKKGNLGGFIFGMEPRLTGTTALLSGLTQRKDPDTGFHVEAFYRIAINDYISITPGVVWLTAPNHNKNNDDIILGVVRTTFAF
ncbi:iron uptake porin [Altericista sp. CCNU0014]|uniref:iron uptake porin n=1 Tax=Altericista sp. CCNU0014 TaxID=3082949 RepID=UPI00385081AA